MKFEIELLDGEYLIEVDAEVCGQSADSGADNPDDFHGYMDIEWEPLNGTRYDVYGVLIELTKGQLWEVAEKYRDEAQAEITKVVMEYSKQYAEDAALDNYDDSRYD